MKRESLFKEVFRHKETNCTIIGDDEKTVRTAISSIKHHRNELDEYVGNHPEFLYSLTPIRVDEAPLVVRLMADSAEKANVGPMAAVAGVLADLAVKEMTIIGGHVAVVENGGEVSAICDIPINVALAAGDSPLSRTFGFRLKDFPIGVATSSGLYSHALSFGEAEAVTVFSTNAGLADAAATAVGNRMQGKNCRRAIQRGIKEALSIEGVEGVLIIYKGTVGTGGRIPQLIKINPTETAPIHLTS